MFKKLLISVAVTCLLSTAPAFSETVVDNIDDPVILSLPNGFNPDGTTIASDGTIYSISIFNGKVIRGNVDNKEISEVIVEGVTDRPGWGMELDDTEKHLFVAGGLSGDARVYNAKTGKLEADITLTDSGVVNDVIVTSNAAYFTNSKTPEIYELPIDKDGTVNGDPRTIKLSGDFQFGADYFANANGIVVAGNGKLIVAHSYLGKMYAIDIASGVATEITLGNENVSSDGIALDGLTLFGTEPMKNRVAEMKLSEDLSEAQVVRRFTAKILNFPSLVQVAGGYVYIVNAKLGINRTEDVTYQIIRFPRF